MKYSTDSGQIIELAAHPLGRGGEGVIWPLAGRLDLVAKILHQPTPERLAKLEFMIANPLPQAANHWWATWPRDLLYTVGAKPNFAGFTMPKLTQGQPLFIAYNPGARRQKLPDFDYRHLVRCGRNLAAAFSLVHAHGHLIGDPNESNAQVSADACVSLFDVDSWQIVDGGHGRIFRSKVAKADFLPPELQNGGRKHLDRQTWHDNFALAVLLFKLLGEGCHPCDGVYQGGGVVPPIEARIAAGVFPFLGKSGRWRPKGLAVPFDSLHPRLQKLFAQAFETGHAQPKARPSARECQEALALAELELTGCQRSSTHWFWGNQCVWCQRQSLLGGRDPFPGGKPKPNRPSASVARPAPMPVPASRPEAIPSPSPAMPVPAPAKGTPTSAKPNDPEGALAGFLVVLFIFWLGFIAGAFIWHHLPALNLKSLETQIQNEMPIKDSGEIKVSENVKSTEMPMQASPPRVYKMDAGVSGPVAATTVACTGAASTENIATRDGGVMVGTTGTTTTEVLVARDVCLHVGAGSEVRVGKDGVWINGVRALGPWEDGVPLRVWVNGVELSAHNP